ncbi:hypothetical protein T4C_6417 [Trichinella pseudospiralis]|uniref:Uncharacterized protein n=1 Tax=Trichinella pseudospiralis TaxID=6337 RepID=A0A0V1JBA1_TRIPS|nr:hypothetical protein T4C_2163 [Trichinella pseudospiralis]KRZ32265.1 hypothetical protein T4C_6417 [Trichinella pseudospiralis]
MFESVEGDWIVEGKVIFTNWERLIALKGIVGSKLASADTTATKSIIIIECAEQMPFTLFINTQDIVNELWRTLLNMIKSMCCKNYFQISIFSDHSSVHFLHICHLDIIKSSSLI